MPQFVSGADVFEICAPIEGARASALANPQFGPGGTNLTYIPDLDAALESGQIKWVGRHEFDPATVSSRIEDPEFRIVDPDLPARALDPAEARRRGFVEGAVQEATVSARQTAIAVGAAAGSDHIDEGAR